MAVLSKMLASTASLLLAIAALTPLTIAQRPMENLGRGVVAVRTSDAEAFISWRLLGLDEEGIGFNLYRSSGGAAAEKINDDVLTAGTNFLDPDADVSVDNVYHVRAVLDGAEGEASGSFTLASDNAAEPVVRIPIADSGVIRYVWVGDLDGDGEYDFVLDRSGTTQSIEAYLSDGTLLWQVDLGPNSENQNNISPGSTAVNTGHWDGVTVYDFDGDGKAEVALRIANGVVFGDGATFDHDSDDEQFMAILDGETGALRSSSPIPTDFLADGPLAARLGVGYLDGVTPHLVAYTKNRQESGAFNLMITAWTFDGSDITQAWKWIRDDDGQADGHNTRIIDADQDGIDEVHEIGFALNGDGTLKYSLGAQGIVHGDRFHIAKIDPERAGLQGFGVQQDNPDALKEYYYDATDGTVLWTHYGEEGVIYDVGRGMVGDINPDYPGMEVWSFDGVFTGSSEELTSAPENSPWPHLGLFWDGDALMELYNDGKIEKWNPETEGVERIFKIQDFGGVNANGPNPAFHGDILGDWREEVILPNAEQTELLIFTTNQPSDIRLYTLAHNPAYRNAMTLKGYVQSHHVDYFIGAGMSPPARPAITYVGA